MEVESLVLTVYADKQDDERSSWSFGQWFTATAASFVAGFGKFQD
jgi:hypothetical protein